jgi:hypothetical protein
MTQQHTAAAGEPLAVVLRQLNERLQRAAQCAAHASSTASAATWHAGELPHLQQAAAALRQHCQPGESAALDCIELLLQQLLRPPEQLFSGLSGAPSEPPTGCELAGVCEQWWAWRCWVARTCQGAAQRVCQGGGACVHSLHAPWSAAPPQQAHTTTHTPGAHLY